MEPEDVEDYLDGLICVLESMEFLTLDEWNEIDFCRYREWTLEDYEVSIEGETD